jgi:hypothetical protein
VNQVKGYHPDLPHYEQSWMLVSKVWVRVDTVTSAMSIMRGKATGDLRTGRLKWKDHRPMAHRRHRLHAGYPVHRLHRMSSTDQCKFGSHKECHLDRLILPLLRSETTKECNEDPKQIYVRVSGDRLEMLRRPLERVQRMILLPVQIALGSPLMRFILIADMTIGGSRLGTAKKPACTDETRHPRFNEVWKDNSAPLLIHNAVPSSRTQGMLADSLTTRLCLTETESRDLLTIHLKRVSVRKCRLKFQDSRHLSLNRNWPPWSRKLPIWKGCALWSWACTVEGHHVPPTAMQVLRHRL